ncbi:MAG: S41 family peptidase [Muribaculaceae bacterium]|nr:S41 family peptidase [Muribaculaceae bacterium]
MKRLTLLVVVIATALLGLNAQNAIESALRRAQQQQQQQRNDFTPEMKLRYAERIIENFYVDDVDSVAAERMVQDAIIAMLKNLDPHSTYSDPDETRELTTPLEGNFSGIGIQFNMLNDTLFVIQTTPGGPCEKVGVLPGDRILSANDTIISGRKLQNADIIKTLRGPKGTRVDLKVMRRGEPEPLTFSLVRDDIPMYSVDASFMADPTTGYVRITRFAQDTDRELAEAIDKLKKQGMKNIIIDLEDNGGGYLGAATSIANMFLPKGAPIVYTESPRQGSNYFNADKNGRFLDGRVVIMVNQYSASASEILSGAIQDNDRGLIVGRRTFGKGLVQRPFPFPDGSMIRLTVSRYHTPSGRCIQRPYDSGDPEEYNMDFVRRYEHGEFMSADSIQFADSLRFETLHNRRPVYGGGGIMPDLFVPVDTTGYSAYYRDLVARGVINSFAISYVDDNREKLKKEYPTEQAFLDRFEVTPGMIDDLVKLAQSREIEPNPEALETSRNTIEIILKGIIGRDLFEQSTYYRAVYPVLNPEYRAALDLINDTKQYNELLKGKK